MHLAYKRLCTYSVYKNFKSQCPKSGGPQNPPNRHQNEQHIYLKSAQKLSHLETADLTGPKSDHQIASFICGISSKKGSFSAPKKMRLIWLCERRKVGANRPAGRPAAHLQKKPTGFDNRTRFARAKRVIYWQLYYQIGSCNQRVNSHAAIS